MAGFRKEKLASLLQQELGNLLLREFNFEGALVTITEVLLNKDLQVAQVYLSILPVEKAPEIRTMIEHRAKELEWRLVRRLRIKTVPHLQFKLFQG